MNTFRSVARMRAEHGVTIMEMTVVMALMAIAGGIFGPILTSTMTSAQRTSSQSESVDNLRFATTAIARELRSAVCITSPTENTTGTSLQFTTSANDTSYEVQYIVSGSKLTRQVVGSAQVTTVASSLVSTSDAFRQISTPRRTVVLTFRVQTSPKISPRVLTTTIAGRNAWRTCA
jgi:Tfp pilus assembly protein FimT